MDGARKKHTVVNDTLENYYISHCDEKKGASKKGIMNGNLSVRWTLEKLMDEAWERDDERDT